MRKELVHISKYLSLILRHRPETIGLALDDEGWVSISKLLRAAKKHGNPIDRSTLDEVVFSNDKMRFAFSKDGLRIRANQGHSISVNLNLESLDPPSLLYHGTAIRFIESIRASGLEKRNRQHVHLSATKETAISVGKRHGKPVVLTIQAKRMFDEGHQFYLSQNGVWLTKHVPYQYIQEPN